MNWHEKTPAEVLEELGVNQNGLSSAQATARTSLFGPNALPEERRRSGLRVFLRQFKSPLIYLLFVAAAIAFALGERGDAAVILFVVTTNALIGAFQEGRAERSMKALRRLSEAHARTLREGHEQMLEARALVPGDVVLLGAGDAVLADARLLEASSLEVAEAALTGESLPVPKQVEPVGEDAVLAERLSMVYSGTHVTAGRGRAVVVATGLRTEVGKIAALTESAEEPQTPLERRIEQFGRYLVFASVAVFLLVLGMGALRQVPFTQLLMVAISQLVAVVPEGLPVAMTIALAVGMQRMAARKTIVRRLAAVESLGSTTVICSDKTGTLTRNEMTVTAVCLPGGESLEVTGIGYAPTGVFKQDGVEVALASTPAIGALARAVAYCNDARLEPPTGPEAPWRPLGDPTEVALLVFAQKAGMDVDALRKNHPRVAELPFSSETKLMAAGDGQTVYVKGATESVLELCSFDAATRARIREDNERLATQGLRVLAAARCELSARGLLAVSALRGHATFLGLVAQFDPPREEVRDAIAECRTAGIRTLMVTGDHKVTGQSIARSLGIAAEGDLALDSRELESLNEAQLKEQVRRTSVFARVYPAQKFKIVEALQSHGMVVAMTGDGVNDAPALARADVGVAMGITGTEVAKEAAKIVITDDNFATIVRAVEEGRVVYRNIKKAILLLLSTGVAEVLVLLVSLALGYPVPFAAVQILWNNVVTEGTVTVNLVMEPREGDEMRQPPIPRNEAILTRPMMGRLLLMSITISVCTLGFFIYHLRRGVPFAQAQTATFTLLAVCEWFNVINCRSETRSAFTLGLFKNRWLIGGIVLSNLLQIAVVYVPFLNTVFKTVPLPPSEVSLIAAVGSVVLWVEEARKWVARRRLATA